VAVIFAGTRGFSDQVPVDQMAAWEEGLHRFLDVAYAELPETIDREKEITPAIEARLKEALQAYNITWKR
jgi:F-type H+-transporting ATPase subunit alpha